MADLKAKMDDMAEEFGEMLRVRATSTKKHPPSAMTPHPSSCNILTFFRLSFSLFRLSLLPLFFSLFRLSRGMRVALLSLFVVAASIDLTGGLLVSRITLYFHSTPTTTTTTYFTLTFAGNAGEDARAHRDQQQQLRGRGRADPAAHGGAQDERLVTATLADNTRRTGRGSTPRRMPCA